MPMDPFLAARWAEGIVATDVTVKQAKGRALALQLGFDAGPAGADGGVDGYAECDGVRAVFFCRLSAKPLSVKDAREFAAVLVKRRATAGVCVAGAGYAPGFEAEVQAVLAGARRRIARHLLTLVDVLAETPAYLAACRDVPVLDTPPHVDLGAPPAPDASPLG